MHETISTREQAGGQPGTPLPHRRWGFGGQDVPPLAEEPVPAAGASQAAPARARGERQEPAALGSSPRQLS